MARFSQMITLLISIAIFCVVLSAADVMTTSDTGFQVGYILQPYDHFNAYQPDVFQQRYYVSTEGASPDTDLMFLYVGGEADIDYYWKSSGGYFREMAKRAGAVTVFLEHRGYGNSTVAPFTKLKPFMTIQNALADMAEFLTAKSLADRGKKYRVVAGGGSYAGELAVYARVWYPHLITAAIGSSAPFQMMGRPYYDQDPMNYEYFRKVTSTFRLIDSRCPTIVQKGYNQLNQLYTAGKVYEIQKILNLSAPPKSNDSEAIEYIRLWIRQAYTNLAQTNHPSHDWPVEKSCHAMLNAFDAKPENPLGAIRAAMDIAYGHVVHDVYDEFVYCVDESGCGNDISGESWDLQACAQLTYFPSTNNKTDMFPVRVHDLKHHAKYCKDVHGIDILKFNRHLSLTRDFPNYDEDWKDIKNVVVTTGLLDPWCSGSVQHSLSPYFLAINIPGASHHLDLNTPTVNDPEWIHPVREMLFEIVMEFVKPEPSQARLEQFRKRIDREYPEDCYSDKL